jgi:hypothetical protein
LSGGVAAAWVLPLASADPANALIVVGGLFGCMLIFGLGLLVSGRNEEAWSADDRRVLVALIALAVLGILVCLVGLFYSTHLWEFVVVCCLFLACVGLGAWVGRRRVEGEEAGRVSARLRGLSRRLAYAAAFLGCGLVGLFAAWLLWNGTRIDESGGPTGPVARYPVRGTCTDGVCSVNECASPEPCGTKALGRLHEGEVAEVVCQTRGGTVRAADGRSSTIWDKLLDGNFVTDLYVDTPYLDRLVPGIRRCGVAG